MLSSNLTGLLCFVTFCLNALIDVDLAVSQQPHHPTDQLHKGIYLIPYIILRQVTKNIQGKKRKKEGE